MSKATFEPTKFIKRVLEKEDATRGLPKDTVFGALEKSIIRSYLDTLESQDVDVSCYVDYDDDKASIELYREYVLVDEVKDPNREIAISSLPFDPMAPKKKPGEPYSVLVEDIDLGKICDNAVKKYLRSCIFIQAIQELASSKGLPQDAVVHALEESIQRAYIKFLGGGDDAIVSCHVDMDKGLIDLAQSFNVVEEVQDDYLEISLEDANEGRKKNKYKVGDLYSVPCKIDDLGKVTATAVKNYFRQRLAEAERAELYNVYKEHIGELVTGIVDKADERSVTVIINNATVELTRKELIGDEFFRNGDPIKVYIQEVRSAEPVDGKPNRGPQIQATRSSEGFLKRLFEQEIHEIYDGTILIKAIARQAGVRSKVAVVSTKEDVDATGACIGPGGSRIQKIVAQLGNGKNKEKIDVINYSQNMGYFIIEAVRPAKALALYLDDENKAATVLIEDDTTPLALGKMKANLNLAKKITGFDIEFIERSKAEEYNYDFVDAAEWKRLAEEEEEARKRESEAAMLRARQEEAARKKKEEEERLARLAAEEEAKKAEEVKKEETPEPTPVVKPAPKADVDPSSFPSEAVNPAAAALAAARAAEEARKAAEEEAKKQAESEPAVTSVETTTTLDALERELAESKKKESRPAAKSRRPRKITEEEVPHEAAPVVKPAQPAMPVYTEEELSEIESEEESIYDTNEDDIEEDYSDYDYYGDDDD